MRRTILAVLSLMALLVTSACGSGGPQAKSTPATTAISTTVKPRGGGSASTDEATARACEAMAVMLDSYQTDFSARLSDKVDTSKLRVLLKNSAIKSKWPGVAAELDAAATEAEAANSAGGANPNQESADWSQMFDHGTKAADECGKIPAAARTAGGFTGYKYGAFLSKCGSTCCRGGPCPGPNDPPYIYRAMSDGITRMGFVDPNTRSEVQPGTYMTDGGTGPDCHWAKLRSSDPNDIVQKGQGTGVQTVVIDSPYFQSDRCGVWWMVGYPRP